MAESAPESRSVLQLPLVVLKKVASMFPRYDGEYLGVLKDRLQLASVNRELRLAVLSSMQQMRRRHMRIEIYQNNTIVAGIIVKNELCSSHSVTRRLLSGTQQMIRRMRRHSTNDTTRVNHDSNRELRSAYTQMDCIDALLAFAQPNSLRLILSGDGKLLSRNLILLHSMPLQLTSLALELSVGVDLQFDQILQAVATKTNLETLMLHVYSYDDSAAAAHKNSTPSVPKNSPFNHLLTLKNLRTLRIDADGLLSPAQMADLLNRSQSKITHICCERYDNCEMEQLLEALSDVVRGNIVSLCCVRFPSHVAVAGVDQLQFLLRLSNCAAVHFQSYDSVSWQMVHELGDWLLDVCCADDVHPGRTLECSVGIYLSVQPRKSVLQEYLEEGAETQMEYARKDTVVRLSIGSERLMQHKHFSFMRDPYDEM